MYADPIAVSSDGEWVNGGVWSTQDSRAMMAYWLTERQQLAKASMLRMTEGFAADWLMDAPLKSFGTTTWASSSGDTLLTYDAFGHASAMVRGMFEYLYEATTLELVPHQPDNITQVQQNFGVRWGPYRLFISAVGVRSSGIAAVTVNGAALKPPHRFNATSLALEFAAMPKATAAAAAAVESDISTAADRVAVQICVPAARQGRGEGWGPEDRDGELLARCPDLDAAALRSVPLRR